MNLDNEKTEELISDQDVIQNAHKKKRLVLIFGTSLLIAIIGLIIFLPNYLKVSKLNKALELGEHYLEQGSYQEAILAYNKVLEIDQKNVTAYEAIASSYIELEEYDNAEDILNTAKSIEDTSNNDVLMSQVLINTDREDEAHELLDEALKNPPQNANLVIDMIDECFNSYEYENIIPFLENAIAQNEDQKELSPLYDKLYYYYLKDHRSDEEIKNLVETAYKLTFDERFNVFIKTDFEEAKTDSATGVQLTDTYYKIPTFQNTSDSSQKITSTFVQLEDTWKTESSSDMERYLNDPISMANSNYTYVNTDQVDCFMCYYDNDIISFQQNRYTYYGGPHGYDEKTTHTFNLKTGQEINPIDFFCISDETTLRGKLTQEFSALKSRTTEFNGSSYQYSDVDLEEVYDKVLDDAVFTLTDDGLSILFNAYDVACYATGPVEVIIPFTRTDLLKPVESLAEIDL